MSSRRFWKCPNCGRYFRKKGQMHSCVSVSVEEHFKNKPAKLRSIFDLILRELGKNGTVRVDAVKSGINFAGESHFGGVQVLKDNISLGFLLDRKVENPRIRRVQKITETTYVHTVNLRELS